MALSSLFRKASSLLGIGSPEKPPPLDGEIVYCKNNVCVHPPAVLSTEVEHYPGYLNIRSQDDEVRLCLNSILLDQPDTCTTILQYPHIVSE